MNSSTSKHHKKRWKGFMRSPAVALAGIIAGCIIGIYVAPVAQVLAAFGQMYVSLLMMCILPIIVTAVVAGIAKIVRTPEIRSQLTRLAAYYAVGIFVPSCVGALTALIGSPGKNLSAASMSSLGEMILSSKVDSGGPSGGSGMLPFLISIVPSNIFESLSKGHIVSIVFACILIGVAFGLVRSKGSEETLRALDVTYDSFVLIFNWVLQILPIGLCFVFAGLAADLNLDILQALVKFIVYFHLASIFLLFLYNAFLWRAVGGSFWGGLQALKQPLVLAYTVNSSIVALSACLESLDERLRVDRRIGGLILPFGMVANRQGKICLFAFISVFLAQIHGVHVGLTEMLIMIIASSLAGMAAVGSGLVLASSLVVVLQAVAVPEVLAPAILITAGPIIERIQSSVTVLANCALAALAASPKRAEVVAFEGETVAPPAVDPETGP